ncbi:hypothetical protein Mapa_000424 [Marchantia paleacea]|nr:hypothetical protein Mapa_000424 [Marchantia paleacea]
MLLDQVVSVIGAARGAELMDRLSRLSHVRESAHSLDSFPRTRCAEKRMEPEDKTLSQCGAESGTECTALPATVSDHMRYNAPGNKRVKYHCL